MTAKDIKQNKGKRVAIIYRTYRSKGVYIGVIKSVGSAFLILSTNSDMYGEQEIKLRVDGVETLLTENEI